MSDGLPQKSTKLDVSDNPKAVRKLRTAVEKAKRALSSSTTTEIEVDAIHDGQDLLIMKESDILGIIG